MANLTEYSMFKPSCKERLCSGGPGSSVDRATDYGLDGPGSNLAVALETPNEKVV